MELPRFENEAAEKLRCAAYQANGTAVTTADTGLGTTYERWALNRLLSRLQAELGLESLVEGPGDGMTGIAGLNSLILGLQGVSVGLVLPDPDQAAFARMVWAHHAPFARFEVIEALRSKPGRANGGRYAYLPLPDASVDLAWNFNIMARQSHPQEVLSELARVSRKYVLVFVPNRLNYAFVLHRLHHRVARQPWDHGRVELMRPQPWQRMFSSLGLRVQEIFWMDCPWWPDIVDFGQLISDFFPPLRGFAGRARPENRLRWEAQALPYYRPADYPEVHRQMSRLAFIENSGLTWLKRRFAHHVGILGLKTV